MKEIIYSLFLHCLNIRLFTPIYCTVCACPDNAEIKNRPEKILRRINDAYSAAL